MISSAWVSWNKPDLKDRMESMNYWLNRFAPLLDKKQFTKKIGLAFTNRCGKDKDTFFVGSTLHVTLNPISNANYLSVDKEEVLISEFNLN